MADTDVVSRAGPPPPTGSVSSAGVPPDSGHTSYSWLSLHFSKGLSLSLIFRLPLKYLENAFLLPIISLGGHISVCALALLIFFLKYLYIVTLVTPYYSLVIFPLFVRFLFNFQVTEGLTVQPG